MSLIHNSQFLTLNSFIIHCPSFIVRACLPCAMLGSWPAPLSVGTACLPVGRGPVTSRTWKEEISQTPLEKAGL
jgi:hypothetical protein